MTLKQIKKDCPLLRLIVSYADIDQSHLGTIYQATNWIYVGDYCKGESHAYLINGKKIHEKSVKQTVIRKGLPSSIENVKRVYKTKDVSLFVTQGKRKYLMPLDKQIRAKILPLAKPYPKADENWKKIDRNEFKKQE